MDRSQTNPARKRIPSASAAVSRGALDMNFYRGGQNLAAERSRALLIGQGLQEKLNCLADIRERLLDVPPLRLAPLQFRAPGVISVLVLFDHDADLACHTVILPPAAPRELGNRAVASPLGYDDNPSCPSQVLNPQVEQTPLRLLETIGCRTGEGANLHARLRPRARRD